MMLNAHFSAAQTDWWLNKYCIGDLDTKQKFIIVPIIDKGMKRVASYPSTYRLINMGTET